MMFTPRFASARQTAPSDPGRLSMRMVNSLVMGTLGTLLDNRSCGIRPDQIEWPEGAAWLVPECYVEHWVDTRGQFDSMRPRHLRARPIAATERILLGQIAAIGFSPPRCARCQRTY